MGSMRRQMAQSSAASIWPFKTGLISEGQLYYQKWYNSTTVPFIRPHAFLRASSSSVIGLKHLLTRLIRISRISWPSIAQTNRRPTEGATAMPCIRRPTLLSMISPANTGSYIIRRVLGPETYQIVLAENEKHDTIAHSYQLSRFRFRT